MKVSQNTKDALAVLLVFSLGFFAVSGDGFSDLAKTKFWWNFWSVLGVIGWLGFAGLWIFWKVKDRARNKAEYESKKKLN